MLIEGPLKYLIFAIVKLQLEDFENSFPSIKYLRT